MPVLAKLGAGARRRDRPLQPFVPLLVHGVLPAGRRRMGGVVRQVLAALLGVVVEHVHNGRVRLQLGDALGVQVRVLVDQVGQELDAVVEFDLGLVVGVGVEADHHHGHHGAVDAPGRAGGGALVLEALLHRLEGVVDLARLAAGLFLPAVRVLVHLDRDRERRAAVFVAADPERVGEAVGGGVALAAALLGARGAEAAALALVALVGRERRAVGVAHLGKQLVEDDGFPALRRDGPLVPVGVGLGLQVVFARGAQPVSTVLRHPLLPERHGLAVRAKGVAPRLARLKPAAVPSAVLAVAHGHVGARGARVEVGNAARVEDKPARIALVCRAHDTRGTEGFGLALSPLQLFAIVGRVRLRVGRVRGPQRQPARVRQFLGHRLQLFGDGGVDLRLLGRHRGRTGPLVVKEADVDPLWNLADADAPVAHAASPLGRLFFP